MESIQFKKDVKYRLVLSDEGRLYEQINNVKHLHMIKSIYISFIDL